MAQNEQWCLAAKSVSSSGCDGTSDSTDARPAPPNARQGTAAVAGLPLAAKSAQAARMLAASVCWPAFSVAGTGAFGSSNRYWSSDPCVATGGGMSDGAKICGAASSLNSGCSLLDRRGGFGFSSLQCPEP